MSKALTPQLFKRLKQVDTPTVCNAIEVAQGRRGFQGFTRSTVIASNPGAAPVVGYAVTATIRAAVPPDEPVDQTRARRMAYFEAMAAAPAPAVAVIGDLDAPGPVGAWWGEVHAAVHKGLGLEGALTNGLMRDLGDMDPDFPVLAGGIGPSHAFVHVVEIGVPVEVFGLKVESGDLIHADRHGAVVIPPDVLGDLGAAMDRLAQSEALILGPAAETGFDIDALRTAWAAFEKART